MNNELSHRDRIEKVLSGENPDRIPISLWRHFPVDDQYPERLARATLIFQKKYDFDFVKVTPSSSFCLKDWGVQDEWKGNPEGTRNYLSTIQLRLEDFYKFSLNDPKTGYLGQQLDCLKILKKEVALDTPIIQTIFSPLSQLKNLIGKHNIPCFLRLHPQEALQLLDVITITTSNFINECQTIGIDGIFFAVQQASFDILNENEFELFGQKYDLKVLSVINDFWFNILHLHGNNVMFDIVKNYPCQVVNWHDREAFPSLREAFNQSNKVLCGGINRMRTMVLGDEELIRNEIITATEQTGGRRLIVSTGCVLPMITPECNISYARSVVDTISNS